MNSSLLKKLPKCIYCAAELHYGPDDASVHCFSCGHEMEIARFTQEEKRLVQAVEEARRSSEQAEAAVREAVDQLTKSQSAADMLAREQAEAQHQAVMGQLNQLIFQQQNSQATLLQNYFEMAEAAQKAGRFSEAIGHYQKVAASSPKPEAEVHWRIALCRYGVEYVQEQASQMWLPTITHMIGDSLLADADYIYAVQFAQTDAMRAYYQQEGGRIDQILNKYRQVYGQETPYNVFISVKQGDSAGRPTEDSFTAMQLYYTLSAKGYHVFNSKFSLQAHAGLEYEPYIMAALKSARVMIVVGTRPEYLSAPWVRNEWRRFRWLQENERGTRRLITYIGGMSAKDVPSEMGALQIVSANSNPNPFGTIEEAVEKVFSKNAPAAAAGGAQPVPAGADVEKLLQRAEIFLEDGEFDRADEYCEQALDQDPQNAQAYILKLCAERKLHAESELAQQSFDINENLLFKRAVRYASGAYLQVLQGYAASVGRLRRDKAAGNALDKLLKRAEMFLEDGEFDRADEYCEQVLDQQPENCRAYVLKLCAEFQLPGERALSALTEALDGNKNYKRALQFADEAYRETLSGYNDRIKKEIRRREDERLAAEKARAAAEAEAREKKLREEQERARREAEERARREAEERARREAEERARREAEERARREAEERARREAEERARREAEERARREAEERARREAEERARREAEERARREAAERDAEIYRKAKEAFERELEESRVRREAQKTAQLGSVVRAVNAYRLKREAEQRRAEELQRLEKQRSAIHSAREAADRARERERANAAAAEEALRKERDAAAREGRKAPNAMLCRVCQKRLEYADGDTVAQCPVCGYKNPIEGADSGEYSIKFKPGAEKVVYSGGKAEAGKQDDGAYSTMQCVNCKRRLRFSAGQSTVTCPSCGKSNRTGEESKPAPGAKNTFPCSACGQLLEYEDRDYAVSCPVCKKLNVVDRQKKSGGAKQKKDDGEYSTMLCPTCKQRIKYHPDTKSITCPSCRNTFDLGASPDGEYRTLSCPNCRKTVRVSTGSTGVICPDCRKPILVSEEEQKKQTETILSGEFSTMLCPTCKQRIKYHPDAKSITCPSCRNTFDLGASPDGEYRTLSCPNCRKTVRVSTGSAGVICPDCRKPILVSEEEQKKQTETILSGEFSTIQCKTCRQTIKIKPGQKTATCPSCRQKNTIGEEQKTVKTAPKDPAPSGGFDDTFANIFGNGAKQTKEQQAAGSAPKGTFPLAVKTRRSTIGAGDAHSLAITRDGRALAVGKNNKNQCKVGGWKDLVSISGGENHTVGLMKNGTCVAVGPGIMGTAKLKVGDWKDIVAIAAGYDHTLGVKKNGTVLAVGSDSFGRLNVKDWTDVVNIATSYWHTVACRKDGTCCAVGEAKDGKLKVSDWTDVVDVAAGQAHTVGLRKDGTVVAVGRASHGRCDVGDWRNIVAIAAGYDSTFGVTADGRVLCNGDLKKDVKAQIAAWTDVTDVAAFKFHVVALRKDGTVVAAGFNLSGQLKVDEWRNIRQPD